MDKIGFIGIQVEGSVGNKKLSPSEIDISEIREVLLEFENFLFEGEKNDRPLVSYKIVEGSVIHKFILPVTFVIIFNSLTNTIKDEDSINFLEPKQSKSIEYFQNKAIEKDWRFSFPTSLDSHNNLVIDKKTKYFRNSPKWVDTELYLYGDIFDVGGLNKPNIHISTKEYGSLIIETTKNKLSAEGTNLLYKTFGIRVMAKQNIEDGTLKELKLIDIVDYNTNFDKESFDLKVSRATKNLSKIKNPDKWIREMRGSI